MHKYFSDLTNVPTFTLQCNDWFFAQSFMANNLAIFDDLVTQLKVQQRVEAPPSGTATMAVTNTYLGVIFQMYYNIEQGYGKEVGKAQRNRLLAVLQGAAATYPVITEFLADLAAEQATTQDSLVEYGRKNLRGKLG
jgi:hypothetical protein